VTGKSLEQIFHIDGDILERQYKHHLSDFEQWDQRKHAADWMLFEKNMGRYLSIDETAMSNGDLYTILSNKEAHGKQHSIIAMVAGTNSDDVSKIVCQIDEDLRDSVIEVTHDLSDSMRAIVDKCFPRARHTVDRFHVQKLANVAVQEMRIKHRWEAIQADTDEREAAKLEGRKFVPERLSNGDTLKELLARSRYLLFKSANNWSESQKVRAKLLFERFPDLKEAYSLAHSLRMIFSKPSQKDAARLNLARWYNRVAESEFSSFNVLAATVYEHYEDILNYFIDRSTNASAESLNAKIKAFRSCLHGVNDRDFFLYRISKLYA
jgi:transposase